MALPKSTVTLPKPTLEIGKHCCVFSVDKNQSLDHSGASNARTCKDLARSRLFNYDLQACCRIVIFYDASIGHISMCLLQ